jgi:hypothetical protein
MVGVKLRELAYVSQQRAGEPICCTVFDPLLDLLWTASSTVRYFWSLHTYCELHICCIFCDEEGNLCSTTVLVFGAWVDINLHNCHMTLRL